MRVCKVELMPGHDRMPGESSRVLFGELVLALAAQQRLLDVVSMLFHSRGKFARCLADVEACAVAVGAVDMVNAMIRLIFHCLGRPVQRLSELVASAERRANAQVAQAPAKLQRLAAEVRYADVIVARLIID